MAGAARSQETLEKVRAAGADALEVDVTDQASVVAALREVADRHGRVDLAVNAASPYGGAPLRPVRRRAARRGRALRLRGLVGDAGARRVRLPQRVARAS